MIDQATKDAICERLANGEPLLQICRTPGFPSKSVVYRAIDEKENAYDEAFAGCFARARSEGFDAIAEGTIEIADESRNDWMDGADQEDPGVKAYKFNGEHVQRSKLRIETRLKLLAKWSPKYAEKLDLRHSGEIATRELSDVERQARILSFLSQARSVKAGDRDA